jgi:hypothetical protein
LDHGDAPGGAEVSFGASAPHDPMDVDINLTPTEADPTSLPSTPRHPKREREVDATSARRNLRDLGQVMRLGPVNISNLSVLSTFSRSEEDVSFIVSSDESEDDFASADEDDFTEEVRDVNIPVPQLGGGMTAAERRAVKRETFDYNKPNQSAKTAADLAIYQGPRRYALTMH